MNSRSQIFYSEPIQFVKSRIARTAWVLMAALAVTTCAFSSPAIAQDSDQQQEERRTELGERQLLVERKMLELENELRSIAERIRPREPERADRLVEAYQQAREKLVTRQMAEITALLNENRMQEAEELLAEVIRDVDDLIRLLSRDQQQKLTRDEEIDMLESIRNDIMEIQRQQNDQTRETGKVGNKEQTLDRLKQQLAQLNDLIERQQQLIESTEGSDGNNLRAMDRLADEQFEIRQQTEDLIDDIASDPTANLGQGGEATAGEGQDGEGQDGEGQDGEGQDGEGQDGEGQDGEGQDGEGQDGEGQDGEGQDGEGQDGEGQDGEGQDGEGQDGEGQDGEGQDGEGQDGEGQDGEGQDGEGQDGEGQQQSGQQQSGQQQSGQQQSGQQQSGQQQSGQQQSPQPGQQQLQEASDHQRRAEEKLGSGKTDDAQEQEQLALDDMQQTRQELEKEMRRIESLPPEAFEQMAEDQRRTRDKALDVIEAMKEMPESADPENQNASQNGQQPGQQQMQQASDAMQQASESLDEQDPQEAQQQQQEAEQQMQQALEDIEERLNQLREETREEKLARLEARFREMLERQSIASVMTVELDDKRTSLGELRRRDELVMLRIATEEREISELGQQAYDLLLEDGTSDVFPEIVQGIREDLNRVADFLESGRTDQLTQLVQKDVEATIEQLLEALKEAKKENDSSGGGGGGGGGSEEQPLLKRSAEYKMLKFRQIRINRRTQQIERIRNQQEQNGEEPDQQLEREFDDAATEQAQLLEMTEQLMEKERQAAQEGGGQ